MCMCRLQSSVCFATCLSTDCSIAVTLPAAASTARLSLPACCWLPDRVLLVLQNQHCTLFPSPPKDCNAQGACVC